MQTRLLVEPGLARLVVAHATRSQLNFLQECLDRGEAANSLEGFEEWDTRLHQAIAEASHNRLMISLYGAITAARDQIEWGELKRRSLTDERRVVLQRQHREIVAALKARDAERAEFLVREHLRTVHRNLLGHSDSEQVLVLPD
jgi:DNA-binding FadR family transcriptional regulator